jgi:tetratricopeptide (TPR) repeat protein
MPRLPHPACAWTSNLLVPGIGEVLLGRIILGTVRALAWSCLAAAAIYQVIFAPASDGHVAAIGLACLAGAVYVSSQIALALGYRTRRQWLQDRRRDEIFRTAMGAYLQGRLDEAEMLLKQLLRADPDDVEATLQLAAIARRRGDAAAARNGLCRARYLDDDGRWDFEIGRELAAIAPQPQAGPEQK